MHNAQPAIIGNAATIGIAATIPADFDTNPAGLATIPAGMSRRDIGLVETAPPIAILSRRDKGPMAKISPNTPGEALSLRDKIMGGGAVSTNTLSLRDNLARAVTKTIKTATKLSIVNCALSIAAALLLLAGCQEADVPAPPLTFAVAAPPVWTDPATGTRATITGDDGDRITTWQTGDKIGVTISYCNTNGTVVAAPPDATLSLTGAGTWALTDGTLAWPADRNIVTATVTATYNEGGDINLPMFETEIEDIPYGAPINIAFDQSSHLTMAIAFAGFASDTEITVAEERVRAIADANGTVWAFVQSTADVLAVSIGGAERTIPADAQKPGTIYTIHSGKPGTTTPDAAAKAGERFKAWAEGIIDGSITDQNYTLTENIDLSAAGNWVPITADGNSYTGTFNGNGYTITGLTVNADYDYAGLFGMVGSEGVIANLTLKDPVISSTESFIGALAGLAFDATITNCRVEGGTVTGRNNTGGLVGSAAATHITNCYAGATVTGEVNIGGLAGQTSGSTIIACHTAGTVTAADDVVGGLVGYNNSGNTVAICYSTANVHSNGATAGGLVGHNFGGNTVASCYARGTMTAGGVLGYTGTIVGRNDAGNTVRYCNGYDTGPLGSLPIGTSSTGTATGNTSYTDPEQIRGTLTHADALPGGVTARIWSAAEKKTENFTFTTALWAEDLTIK